MSSYPIGPVAVTAPGPVPVTLPALQPGQLGAVIVDNATPFVLQLGLTDGARVVPPFTSDRIDLPDSGRTGGVQAVQAPGGPAATTGQSYVTLTFFDVGDTPPGTYPAKLAAQTLSATVGP